jgi:hypothetical protein
MYAAAVIGNRAAGVTATDEAAPTGRAGRPAFFIFLAGFLVTGQSIAASIAGGEASSCNSAWALDLLPLQVKPSQHSYSIAPSDFGFAKAAGGMMRASTSASLGGWRGGGSLIRGAGCAMTGNAIDAAQCYR